MEPLAHRAWKPPTSSSIAEEEHLVSLVLSTAARDFRRSRQFMEPLAHRAWKPSPSSSARRRAISDARGFKPASPLQELRPPSSESDPSGSQASSRPARQRQ